MPISMGFRRHRKEGLRFAAHGWTDRGLFGSAPRHRRLQRDGGVRGRQSAQPARDRRLRDSGSAIRGRLRRPWRHRAAAPRVRHGRRRPRQRGRRRDTDLQHGRRVRNDAPAFARRRVGHGEPEDRRTLRMGNVRGAVQRRTLEPDFDLQTGFDERDFGARAVHGGSRSTSSASMPKAGRTRSASSSADSGRAVRRASSMQVSIAVSFSVRAEDSKRHAVRAAGQPDVLRDRQREPPMEAARNTRSMPVSFP